MKNPNFGPETIHRITTPVPATGYEVTVLAGNTLQLMGYPVSVQTIGKTTAAALMKEIWGPPLSTHQQATLERYPQWARTAIHNPNFGYFTPFAVSGTHNPTFLNEISANSELNNHPATKLVTDVCIGNPFGVDDYKRKLDKGHVPSMARAIDLRAVLAGCYVAAFERFRTPGMGLASEITLRTGQDFWAEWDGSMLPMEFYDNLYQSLREERGVQPIGVEALASLTEDYYRLAEQVSPTFAAMKNLEPIPRAPDTQPELI